MLSAVIPLPSSQPTQCAPGGTTGTEVRPSRSLVPGTALLKFPARFRDRSHDVLSESSRTAMAQPLDPFSPRCDSPTSKVPNLYRRWTLEQIILLSPGYLLSVERPRTHVPWPDHELLHLLDPSVSQSSPLYRHRHLITNQAEGTFGAPPLHFRRQPPQLNYPPGTVPNPDTGQG